MPQVLTTATAVTCGHGGRAATSSGAKLRVAGQPVLPRPGFEGTAVSSCTTVPKSDAAGTPTDAPCLHVKAVTAGASLKLRTGGQAVLLTTLAGSTDGMVLKTTPQTLLAAPVGAPKLLAR